MLGFKLFCVNKSDLWYMDVMEKMYFVAILLQIYSKHYISTCINAGHKHKILKDVYLYYTTMDYITLNYITMPSLKIAIHELA